MSRLLLYNSRPVSTTLLKISQDLSYVSLEKRIGIVFPWKSSRKEHGIEESEESFWTFCCSRFWNKISDFPGPFHKAFQCTVRSVTQGPVKGEVEPGRNTTVASWNCCKNSKHSPRLWSSASSGLQGSVPSDHHGYYTGQPAWGGWEKSSRESFMVQLSEMAGTAFCGERKFRFISQLKITLKSRRNSEISQPFSLPSLTNVKGDLKV